MAAKIEYTKRLLQMPKPLCAKTYWYDPIWAKVFVVKSLFKSWFVFLCVLFDRHTVWQCNFTIFSRQPISHAVNLMFLCWIVSTLKPKTNRVHITTVWRTKNTFFIPRDRYLKILLITICKVGTRRGETQVNMLYFMKTEASFRYLQ